MATRSSEVEISIVHKKRNGGHKIGYCSSWKEDYPWLVLTEDTAGIVTGLLCVRRAAVLVSRPVPCTSLHNDCIERHKKIKGASFSSF